MNGIIHVSPLFMVTWQKNAEKVKLDEENTKIAKKKYLKNSKTMNTRRNFHFAIFIGSLRFSF